MSSSMLIRVCGKLKIGFTQNELVFCAVCPVGLLAPAKIPYVIFLAPNYEFIVTYVRGS